MAFFYHKVGIVLRGCICFFALVFACTVQVKASDKITIFAASSLTDVLGDISQKFNDTFPNIDVKISLASSGVLARQIEQGAPADLFISANQDWMTYLSDRQVIESNLITPLLSNELVVVTRKKYPSEVWMELLRSERFAMGDPMHVPAGIYAKYALESSEIWNEIKQNAVFGENVRISLRLVSRGEVGAAIVYNSDALLEKELVIAHRFDTSQHEKIIYPLAVLQQNKTVSIFVDFLTGKEATEIFRAAGFNPVQLDDGDKTNG